MASGSRQPRKGAPNVGPGKRAWRTPIPHLSSSDRKVGRGLMFLGRGRKLYGRLLWLPSQNAPFLECLQPHHATALASTMSTFNGVKLEPLCEPSQNGCALDWPQVHQ